MKAFCEAIQRLLKRKGSGNLWICFLANPQTWEPDELSSLIGSTPWQSPFCLALQQAELMVTVRNDKVNIYERLWCVLERLLAEEFHKFVLVIGRTTPDLKANKFGMNATCSYSKDTEMIKGMIELLDTADRVDTMCLNVIRTDEAID